MDMLLIRLAGTKFTTRTTSITLMLDAIMTRDKIIMIIGTTRYLVVPSTDQTTSRLDSTVQTVQYSTVLYCTVLYSTDITTLTSW